VAHGYPSFFCAFRRRRCRPTAEAGKSAGGNKGVALLAVLARLYIVTAMKQQQRTSTSTSASATLP
jgi:hypothetical protein